jgi:hypothetical protein
VRKASRPRSRSDMPWALRPARSASASWLIPPATACICVTACRSSSLSSFPTRSEDEIVPREQTSLAASAGGLRELSGRLRVTTSQRDLQTDRVVPEQRGSKFKRS